MHAQEREKEKEPVLFFISHSLLAGEGPTLCSFMDFLKKKVSSKQVWTLKSMFLSVKVVSQIQFSLHRCELFPRKKYFSTLKSSFLIGKLEKLEKRQHNKNH